MNLYAATAATAGTCHCRRNSGEKGFSDWEVGPRYSLVRVLGHGSYGEVAEGIDNENGGSRVAIKRILNVFEQDIDAKRIYREMYILRSLRHTEVIRLLDVVSPKDYDSFTDLYLVFEYVDTDLYKLILSPQYLSNAHIQTFLYQMLVGLKHLHSAHVIHRHEACQHPAE
jgi:mitogen-activated protein kinase 1/3